MDKSVPRPQGEGTVEAVVAEIAELLHPKVIYLYNQRISLRGEFVSFKLCVVARFDDKHQAELAVYRHVDSEIPFDVLLYTPEEWEELSRDTAAFASHIIETGTVVYG